MPLIQSKSKKALKSNIKTEIDAHPDKKKQDLAIAFSVQRQNKKKKAKGGMVSSFTKDPDMQKKESNLPEHAQRSKDSFAKEKMAPMYAKGGQIPNLDMESNFKNEERAHVARGGEMTEDSEAENLQSKPAPSSTADVHPADFMHEEERAQSIAHAILGKRKRMAEGGMVDLEANSEESPNMADEYNFDANGKEQYDDSQLGLDPMDSNETGDEREDASENKHDMISSIRKHLKIKRGL